MNPHENILKIASQITDAMELANKIVNLVEENKRLKDDFILIKKCEELSYCSICTSDELYKLAKKYSLNAEILEHIANVCTRTAVTTYDIDLLFSSFNKNKT